MPSPSELPALREMLRHAGIDVAHYSPGRLRLRVGRIKTDASFAAELQHRLGAVPGVREVALRPLTASVLIEFSVDALTSEPARRSLLDVLIGLFPNLDEASLVRLLPKSTPG